MFDELQEFPEIATSLKFFAQDGRFDVICSGSMLGINYQRIESNSVGYKTDYEEDIRKYAQGVDQTRILNVFRQIPVQLAKDNKKFQISKVASGARFKDYRGCIEWLSDAGIANICYCMHMPELPLKGNYDDTKYKICKKYKKIYKLT